MIEKFMKEKSKIVDAYMQELIEKKDDIPVIYEAVKYSVDAGGKRIRPLLCLMSTALFNGSEQRALPFACSIEMIHTYSLIHDDLPCMDNDDFRRGKPSNHKKFGEGYATLAGDALLNLAFETMLSASLKEGDRKSLEAAAIIAKASGMTGMIGGQCIDSYYENKKIDMDILNKMYSLKTGALFTAPLMAGATLAGASERDVEVIEEYGNLIGLAFQITDDILDVTGDQEKLGKAIGSDACNNKSTYVSLLGLERSREIVIELIEKAKKTVSIYEERAMMLTDLADFILTREK